jgi:hypothetical protein
MMPRPPSCLAVFGVMLALGCIGANPESRYMLPGTSNATPGPVPPDKARVVFVQGFGAAAAFPIIDEAGHFVGESTSSSRFSVLVKPGIHYFITWGIGQTAALHAKLGAGRTYWIVVSHRPGLWAVTQQSGMVRDIRAYLAETKVMIPDLRAGQAYLDSIKDEVSSAVRDGIANYKAYSDEEKADARLRIDDDEGHWR